MGTRFPSFSVRLPMFIASLKTYPISSSISQIGFGPGGLTIVIESKGLLPVLTAWRETLSGFGSTDKSVAFENPPSVWRTDGNNERESSLENRQPLLPKKLVKNSPHELIWSSMEGRPRVPFLLQFYDISRLTATCSTARRDFRRNTRQGVRVLQQALKQLLQFLATPTGQWVILGFVSFVALAIVYNRKRQIPGLTVALIPEDTWFINRDDNHRLAIVVSLHLINKSSAPIRIPEM